METNTEITAKNTIEITSYQIDMADEIDAYISLLKENIEYDILQTYLRPSEMESIDEMIDIIVEVIVTKQDTVHIGKLDYPHQLVISRLLKITREHIDYVIECMNKTSSKINNMKSYLLTALFNAPTTMANYYRAEANFDLKGFGRTFHLVENSVFIKKARYAYVLQKLHFAEFLQSIYRHT
jgi:hypothetical protein